MTRREREAEGAEVPNFSRFLLSGESILVGKKFILGYARIPVEGKKKSRKGKARLIVDSRSRVAIGTGKRTPEPVEVRSATATSSPIIRTLGISPLTLEIGDYRVIITEVISSYNGGKFGLKVDSSTPLTFRQVGWRATVPGLREILRRQLEQSPAKK